MVEQYNIYCDDCGKVCGHTDDKGLSEFNDYCTSCRAKYKHNNRVNLGYNSKLNARQSSYKRQDMNIRGVKNG